MGCRLSRTPHTQEGCIQKRINGQNHELFTKENLQKTQNNVRSHSAIVNFLILSSLLTTLWDAYISLVQNSHGCNKCGLHYNFLIANLQISTIPTHNNLRCEKVEGENCLHLIILSKISLVNSVQCIEPECISAVFCINQKKLMDAIMSITDIKFSFKMGVSDILLVLIETS